MDRPRLLWLSQMIPYPPKAGVIMRSYNLLKAVAESFHVDLFCFNQSRFLASLLPEARDPEQLASEELAKLVSRIHVESIPAETGWRGKQRVAAASLLSKLPYSINWLQSKRAQAALREFTADRDYAILHVDTEALIPYMSAAGRVRHRVLNHHNAEAHMMRRRAQKESKRARRAYFDLEATKLERFAKARFHEFDLHLVCSAEDRERLLELDDSLAVEIVPNSVDVPAWENMAARVGDRKSLLFIGGLDWYPNAAAAEFLAQQVWPLVRESIGGASLHFIGKAPPQWLKDVAARDPGIHSHGFVESLDDAYHDAGVFVCPINDGGGTKLKILDAMAHGVPVVAHPIAVEGIELVPGRDVLVGSTAEEMADCVKRVLEDENLAGKLRRNAYCTVNDKYSSTSIGRRLVATYRDRFGLGA